MQSRAIKSLSDNDIKELRRGGGWGLALAAELKGMPGPADLLAGQEPNAKAPRGAGPEAASRPAEQV